MSPVQPGAGSPCSCTVPSSPGRDRSPGPRPRRSRRGRPTAGLPRMRHAVAAVGARPAPPGPRPWLDPTGDAAAASPLPDLRGHARPAARDGAAPARGHHRGHRTALLAPFKICMDLTRSPATDYRPLRINSSRMRVEPGQDLATFPPVVLADLVEGRPGSLAGVAVQRRFLDLQQCADFLGRQDLVSHRRTRPFVPVFLCKAHRSSPPPPGRGSRSGIGRRRQALPASCSSLPSRRSVTTGRHLKRS